MTDINNLIGKAKTFCEQQGARFTPQREKVYQIMLIKNRPMGAYELLDNLSGFGTTSQMFDAAYLRAKEGELARTIVANPNIKAARVHLARARSNPFSKTR